MNLVPFSEHFVCQKSVELHLGMRPARRSASPPAETSFGRPLKNEAAGRSLFRRSSSRLPVELPFRLIPVEGTGPLPWAKATKCWGLVSSPDCRTSHGARNGPTQLAQYCPEQSAQSRAVNFIYFLTYARLIAKHPRKTTKVRREVYARTFDE
jgi:hypothetical protein